MEVNAEDIITAIRNQRDGALNENAQLFAMLQAANREIEKLTNKKATDGTDRDTVHAGDDSEQQCQQN